MEKLSIIIPAHNEVGRGIDKFLESYIEYFKGVKDKNGLDFELIVVANGCSDNTAGVVEGLNSEFIVLLDFKYGGKGFAITEGFKSALSRGSDFIGFVDADGSTSPKAFHDLVRNLSRADGVIGNRWHKNSVIAKQTLFRRFISRGYNFIIRSLFVLPYEDTQCGAKVFRRGVLESNIHRMISSQWNFDVALLFCLRKESRAKIVDVPTTWIDKDASNVNLRRTPMAMFASAIRLRLMHSPFRFLVRVYHLLPEKLKFH